MPKLFVNWGRDGDFFDLRIGSNGIGRAPGNHCQIAEPSVSGHHCELLVGPETMIVSDLGSSNGTFINNVLIKEGFLFPNQVLRLGQVETFVEAPLQLAVGGLTPWHRMNALRERTGLFCSDHEDKTAQVYCASCRKQLCYSCCFPYRPPYGLKTWICKRCGANCIPAAEARGASPNACGDAFAEAVRTSLLPQLASWLKQKFVQVILQQREGLIQTQEAATAQMRHFERRLAKVQSQMDLRIRAYEEQIQTLERELADAAAENQHLIRTRISTLRGDLETESRELITD